MVIGLVGRYGDPAVSRVVVVFNINKGLVLVPGLKMVAKSVLVNRVLAVDVIQLDATLELVSAYMNNLKEIYLFPLILLIYIMFTGYIKKICRLYYFQQNP